MARMIPWAYRPGNSPLHRCPAALKLLGLLGMSGAVFCFGPLALCVWTCGLTALALTAGIRPWELLRGGKNLGLMIVSVLCVRSIKTAPPGFDLNGAKEALFFGWSILLSFSGGALLFSVTTMTELKHSIGSFERALLKRGKRQPLLSLGISLMLGFLPRFFEAWEAANLAWAARGGKRGVRSMAALIPLVSERMMEYALETAQAMEARGLIL
ncbi:MAG: energy-coupling factor transporter transmembrane protein EcfT [Treponema sp.]|nr:energy-coupling factor transporter transmembrane protein EcfT [Treponema sp.]